MRTAELRYELPAEAIAQRPTADRESARLMALRNGRVDHLRVAELAELLPAGSLVVLNDTRVVRARLLGRKRGTGGKAEVFLIRRRLGPSPGSKANGDVWLALARASKGLRPGAIVDVGDLAATVVGFDDEEHLFEVSLSSSNGVPVDSLIRMHGRVPLPPYIRREDDDDDAERYQTVYAKVDGAVAAPTAGLHLTHALLERLRARECTVTTITLHVGLGTFAKPTAGDLDDHKMHEESFDVPVHAARAIEAARAGSAPVVAVGTTVVRALESVADPEREGLVRPFVGSTRLLIQPGYRFRVVDMLLTNFHLPESTLLALVCAFGGTQRVLAAYREAVRDKYRFYSYGDAMLLARAPADRAAQPEGRGRGAP